MVVIILIKQKAPYTTPTSVFICILLLLGILMIICDYINFQNVVICKRLTVKFSFSKYTQKY